MVVACHRVMRHVSLPGVLCASPPNRDSFQSQIVVFTLNYSAIGNETRRADIAVVTVPGTGAGSGPQRAVYSLDIEVVNPLLVR